MHVKGFMKHYSVCVCVCRANSISLYIMYLYTGHKAADRRYQQGKGAEEASQGEGDGDHGSKLHSKLSVRHQQSYPTLSFTTPYRCSPHIFLAPTRMDCFPFCSCCAPFCERIQGKIRTGAKWCPSLTKKGSHE